MSYLKELKEFYYRKIASLEIGFKQEFQKVIDKEVKEIIPKIKQNLENNIVEYIEKYNKSKDNFNIDFEPKLYLTDAFDDFEPVFSKFLNNNDEEDMKQNIENFLEEQDEFKSIKKYLETRFDGLIFHTLLFVKLEEDYFKDWHIIQVYVQINIDISNW